MLHDRAMDHTQWHKHLFDGPPPHDPTGLADAIGQGMLFVRLLDKVRRMDPNDDDPRGQPERLKSWVTGLSGPSEE